MTAKNKVQKATDYAHALDDETQAVLVAVRSKNSKAIKWFVVSWTVLFALAVFGIYYQNHLATQNKQHIDCIIKDLATPLKPGTRAKYIENLSTDCKIRFTT